MRNIFQIKKTPSCGKYISSLGLFCYSVYLIKANSFFFLDISKYGSGLPWGLSGKESACQCRRSSSGWVRSLGWAYPLEKDIATHPSILAWEIPWTEEPGWLQFMGLQRVGLNLVSKQQQIGVWWGSFIDFSKHISNLCQSRNFQRQFSLNKEA